ncbi:hypothetical protein EOD10_25020 [Mesorhizobium sp. M7A.T.Ca.TU.009.01.3.2]|uniref:hypothetical protein n=1 Tax=unclassified Mesorhizobium TaxID=325217 RepID=UPI000FCB6AFC|nr:MULTISPECIES: hypothetical protein [unclassified Mesorhizobium]RUU09406.1 hypothetical protein EOD10_25020 [Mesorhizobium sp. M7A.T.Ca.TU.009.01.3.2]RUU66781.1 hypothetical protein EOC99_05175 [Mesorhizobium sp. M7A.T.Ca.TU.009.01.1.1]RUU89407.1 hypothetical protein EOD03_03225 [Mesorhizobium sp. M7A.T.Ca.TU.009.01.1.2]RUV14365.1 hypothetical protein EOD00_01780 [Mesorhizobium sp. M7A.T.Ca.TU.009.01.3.1]RUT88730.1 hypothetical protein EOD14_05745 [Mesorhizobium sp. M7A.T.Ca.US.000.02.1.1]
MTPFSFGLKTSNLGEQTQINDGCSWNDARLALTGRDPFLYAQPASSIEVVLLEGDATTFDPRRLHTFRNSSATKQAQALFILSPPSV